VHKTFQKESARHRSDGPIPVAGLSQAAPIVPARTELISVRDSVGRQNTPGKGGLAEGVRGGGDL